MQQPPPPPPQMPPPMQAAVPPATPGTFDRDLFLLRQKHLSIKEKYYVTDEHGRHIFYAERPQHLGRNLLAWLGGIVAGIAVGVLCGYIASATEGVIAGIFGSGAFILGLLTLIVVSVALSKKRHLILYGDDTKQHKVLEIRQDKKVQFFKATYTLVDADGTVLALFVNTYIYGILRKRWDVLDGSRNQLSIVREDSIGKAIARRLFGPMFGALRTNFIILTPQEQQIGVFNREFTILDRYVLDMRMDQGRTLDRRIALGIGLMLDTGEKR